MQECLAELPETGLPPNDVDGIFPKIYKRKISGRWPAATWLEFLEKFPHHAPKVAEEDAMKKLLFPGLCAFFLTLALTACGDRPATLPAGEADSGNGAPQEAALAELRAKTAPQFRPYTFTSNGGEIKYNLYGPTGMGIGKKYPLVVFLADAVESVGGASGQLPYGALVWAGPESQAANPCFVLAPQLSAADLTRLSGKSGALAMLPAMIDEVAKRNPIDSKRIYIAGQGLGGSAAMHLNIAGPDIFAASLFVDCGQEGMALDKLVREPFIIFANAGNAQATASMKAIEEACRKAGVSYATAAWDPQLPLQNQEDMVATMLEKKAPVNLFSFEGGKAANASDAWRLAQARNWLFTKSLDK